MTMNELDVAGLLQTYAFKAKSSKDTEQLRRIIRELKADLDLRKLRANKG